MSCSGYQKIWRKDFYLLEDRFFGRYIFFYYHGGREVLAFVVIAHVIPIDYVWRRYCSSGQPWTHTVVMFLWLIPSLGSPILLTVFYVMSILLGRRDVGSDAVFVHVLQEVNERYSNGSAINWRQIAHSANNFSKEQGESPMVFYSGLHCMRYIDNCARNVVGGRSPKYKPLDVVKYHNDIAKSAFEKHKARLEFLSEELKSYSLPPDVWLDMRRRDAGCG